MTTPNEYLKGRGAQINTKNRFHKDELVKEHIESIDDWTVPNEATQYIEQDVKSIVNKVDSPDVGMLYSMNPYAGCEHGCIYCYARNAHEYLGFSAGLDFERKIIVKKNAPKLSTQIPHAARLGSKAHFNKRKYRLLPARRKKIPPHKTVAGSLPGV